MSRHVTSSPASKLRSTRVMSHSFLPALLPADAVVMDLGANCGRFSTEVHDRFGWRCIAVEPNPAMFDRIPERSGIIRIQAAIATRDGPVVLNLASNPESSSLLSISSAAKVGTVTVAGLTLASVASTAGCDRIDLLKMDIEGAEIDLLKSVPDEQWARIRQITIEFHESMGLSTIAQVRGAIAHLEQIGFTALKMSLTHYGDVLFVNTRLCCVTAGDVALFKLLTRNLIWAGRAWERATSRLCRR